MHMLQVDQPDMPCAYRRLRCLLCSVLLLLAACVSLPADFKEPAVSLVSITPQITNVFAPEFDIVLHITNPNREALNIAGLSYTIHLQGNKLIEGVANDFPVVAAYGEADINLHARADLIGGISLLGDLLNQANDQVEFELNAEIDLGTLYPMIRVQRSGVISLQ
jgi:LEA14-like dessication related protein